MPKRSKRLSSKRSGQSTEQRRVLVNETKAPKPSWNLKNCTMDPLREITTSPNEVIITVDLPYTEQSTVKVKPLDSESLEILANMRKKISLDELGIVHHKGEIQKFHCHIHIPVPVKMDRMEVDYKKGLLEIHIPRKR